MRTSIITSRAKGPRAKEPLLKYVHEQLIRLWRDSTKEFILEALDHIAVDTGMSAASLQPLAANVGLKTLIIESLKGKGPKRGHTNAYGTFANNNGPYKSRALGNRLGREAYTLEFGDPQRPIFKFSFRIVVLQHYLHENGYGASSPWLSMEKGKEAFINYWRENYNDYVRTDVIVRYFVTGRVV